MDIFSCESRSVLFFQQAPYLKLVSGITILKFKLSTYKKYTHNMKDCMENNKYKKNIRY